MKVVEGFMFGDFETAKYYFSGEKNSQLPLRETDAICKTSVKLMRIKAK